MKKIALLLSLFVFSVGFSQSLPIDFEGDVTTSDFVDFDGGTATVTTNPSMSGINNSNTVAQIVRDGGAVYSGSKILLDNNLDFSVLTKITMKVYTTAPVGTVVKFKLEGTGTAVDVDAFTTVSGTWETLEWVFVGTANDLNEIVFMFDFGNLGDGTANSTFYFDDVEQVMGPTAPVPTSLPIDFESGIVNTDFLSYSGATTSVVANPQMNGINNSNTVGQVIRDGGDFWASSKVFLTNNLDLSTMWVISTKIYTTAPVGTRIKLELEGPNGRTNLDYLTTVSDDWETASWNFDGKTGDYNKLNFFFDFGTIGDGTASSTFLFDDIQQVVGPVIPDPVATTLPINFEGSVVTSDFINEDGGITTIIPNPQINANNPSATVGQFVRSGGAPWAKSKIALTDFIDNFSTVGSISMKVYTEAPVGTLLKFKIESNVAAFADERNTYTTVSGEWATYTWDFTNFDSPIYNVFTLMLGYATPNDASVNATFLFDDIEQTVTLSGGDDLLFGIEGVSGYPNPTKDIFKITSKNKILERITLFDIRGNQVLDIIPNKLEASINVSNFANGIYIAKIATPKGVGSIKLIVE
tara:strand:+ start:668 stop:2416 length:1749 start_codon:yes stop_codon:yes gene_type:complete